MPVLEHVETRKEAFRKHHSSHHHPNWPIPLPVKTTSAEMAQAAEEHDREMCATYARRFVESVHSNLPADELAAKVQREIEDRERERLNQKSIKAAEAVPDSPDIEFNFTPIRPVADDPSCVLNADPALVLTHLKRLKLTNKTVEEVLKALPKTAYVTASFDESHRILQLTCEEENNVTRIALDAEQKPKKPSDWDVREGKSKGTFYNILKGKTNGNA